MKIGYIQATNEMDVHWFPSLAFGYLKSYLKFHLGDTVSMERLHSLEEIQTCDIVAISSTSQDYEIARRIARDAKRLKQNVITVLGGHHVTYLPGTMTREFDYGVLGEGEETFLELVQHVFEVGPGADPESLRKIKGIVFHDAGSVATTAPRDPISPLDRLPHPFRDRRTAPYIMTSRGCPYRCAFCSSSAFWGKTRFFSARYVVEEIGQILDSYPDVRNISIQDDLFVADTERFEEIVDRLNAGGFNRRASFSFAVRANLVTDRLCERIKKLRVDSVCFGAESGSDRILANMKKGTSVARNQGALDLLHAHRIPVLCSFIVGWPTETEEEVRSTYEFLLGNIKAGKLTPGSVVNILTPMPGTETWRDAVKNGSVQETDFDWGRLGVFASYKHSSAATLADWIGKRRINKSVYLNERNLPQERLYEIMSEFDDKIRALEAPPVKSAPEQPFPLVFPESALAHKYCQGRGLEIGGSAHNPFGLHALNVDMTDSPETVFKREERRLCGRSLPVDIVAGGDAIPRPGESQDFVVSSHVLEHFPNPIKALLEWDRLLRPGGVIFMIVPHKDRTFDRDKERTPLAHVVEDYMRNNTTFSGDPNGHEHFWITEDVVAIARWMIEHLAVNWEIAEIQDVDDKVGNGFTVVLRKTAVLQARDPVQGSGRVEAGHGTSTLKWGKKLRVAVYSFDEPGHACADIRLFAPLKHLEGEVEFRWGVTRKENTFLIDPDGLSWADLVILQRFFPEERTVSFVDRVLRSGVPVLYELDDLLLDVPSTNSNGIYAARCAPYIVKLIRSCAGVTVSTRSLAEEILPYHPGVHVLPNLLDDDLWLAERDGEEGSRGSDRDDRLVIGYTGTPTHHADLEPVEKALDVIADRYKEKVKFLFMGCATDRMLRLPGVSAIGFQPSYREYAKVLRRSRIDIAIAPLADNRFNRCKSNIKWLEYSACGIPGVYPDLPPYRSSIRHGRTGLLVGTRAECWVDAIERLIRNPADRVAIADEARLEIRKEYTLSATAHRYLDVYREILGKVPGTMRKSRQSRVPAGGEERQVGRDAGVPAGWVKETSGGPGRFDVSIVIPLFNKVEYTRNCVEALASASGMEGAAEIVFVDNGSTDGTGEFLASLGGDIVIVRNTKNLGFAASCNQGARVARGRNLVFLNNDTVPQPGWVQALLDAAKEEDAAICGARLIYPDGRIQHAGVAFHSGGIGYHIFNGFPKDHPAVTKRRRFQAVTAACMLVRRDLFEELAGFDEGYRNGFEDVDFCLRAGEKGYRVLYAPESVVVHHEETSEGRKANDRENLERFLERWRGKVEPDDDRIYAEEGFRKIVSSDGTRITIEPAAGQTGVDDPASIGRSLKKEKRYSEAIEAFRQVRSRGDLSVLADIGDCLAQEGKFEEAGSAFQEAITANPRDPRALAGLGVLDLVQGNHARAAERFTSVLETDDRDATALCGMGLARMAGGGTGEAFGWFMRSLDADPVNVPALHELVKAAHGLGRLEEAERYLSTYLQYKPSDPHILFSMAGILFQSGKSDEALDALDRLAFFDPSYKDADELRERIAIRQQAV